MSLQVEKLENNMAKLTIEVPADDLEKALQSAYMKQKNKIAMPGFRKGKVPRQMIEKMYGPEIFYDDAANALIPKAYSEAYDECDLEIVSRPEIYIVQIEKGKSFIFTADVATKPEVKLGEYKGLEVDKVSTRVTQKEVDAKIQEEAEKNAREVVVTDRPVADGDEVILDFEGFVDGEAFEGGKAENHSLEIGSGQFIPGFEDQMIGMTCENEKDVVVTFPEDYHAEDLKGAAVVFKVKVHEVTREVLPELDDDFAKDTNIPNVETVEDLKNTVKERLASAKQAQAENAADEKLFDELTSNVKIDMPDALVEDEVNGQIQQMAAQIQQYGISFTQYLKMMGKTVEDVKNDYRENAEKSVKLRLTLNKIAEVENLEATDEDVEAQYHDLATQYGMEVEKIKPLVSVDMIKQDIKTTKAYNFVKDNAAKA